MSDLFKISGTLEIGDEVIENQVTKEGIKSIMGSLADNSICKITNMMLLNGFVVPAGKSLKDLTFNDVKNYIAYEGFVGNNNKRNEDLTIDMRVYISDTEPFELTSISTIPADKSNSYPFFNAAVLVVDGDENQSTSQSSGVYQETGNEKLFSVCVFNNREKTSTEPFSLVWYIKIQ